MTKEVEKVNNSTIMNFMNASIIIIFGGMKETIIKFIINRYHNGKFYFYTPVEISAETIINSLGYPTKATLFL